MSRPRAGPSGGLPGRNRMPRLIEVQPAGGGRPPLAVHVGDVLLVRASGVRVRDGAAAVDVCGPLQSAVVVGQGDVVVPADRPNAVLVRARAPGSAVLDLFTGDPWHDPRRAALGLTIES